NRDLRSGVLHQPRCGRAARLDLAYAGTASARDAALPRHAQPGPSRSHRALLEDARQAALSRTQAGAARSALGIGKIGSDELPTHVATRPTPAATERRPPTDRPTTIAGRSRHAGSRLASSS